MRTKLLLLLLFITSIAKAQTNPCNRSISASKFPEDTTIFLPSGSSITLNRCEYFDIRNCLSIYELNDTATLRRTGLNSVDENGAPLITCGMINVDLSPCSKRCLERPITVKLRIRFADCYQAEKKVPRLYFGQNGRWETDNNVSYKTAKDEFGEYITFKTNCSFKINCDVPKPKSKVKLKAKKGEKIVSVRVGMSCPLFFYDIKVDNPKRKLKIPFLCNDENKLLLEVVTEKKDGTQSSTRNTLDKFQHGIVKKYCHKFKNWLGIKRRIIKSVFVYKKYHIRLK